MTNLGTSMSIRAKEVEYLATAHPCQAMMSLVGQFTDS